MSSSPSSLAFSVCLIFSPNFFLCFFNFEQIYHQWENKQPTNTNIEHNNEITISLTHGLFVCNLFRIVLANSITQMYVVVIVVVVAYCLCSNKCVCLCVHVCVCVCANVHAISPTSEYKLIHWYLSILSHFRSYGTRWICTALSYVTHVQHRHTHRHSICYCTLG